MKIRSITPGKTQAFIQCLGFKEMHGQVLLVDQEGRARVFYELEADPDHSHFQPDAAYAHLLNGLQPGSTVRFLKFYWPNAAPRREFVRQMTAWQSNLQKRRPELQRGLEQFLASAPLPYFGRTLLECVVESVESQAWIDTVPALLLEFGIEARRLPPDEVQSLALTIFHPELG